MFGTVIYDMSEKTLFSIDDSCKLQIEEVVNLREKNTNQIIFSDFAKTKERYNPLMGDVLLNSKHYPEIQKHIKETLENSELVGIFELDSETGNKIYFCDGQIWNWNFDFIVIYKSE